MVDSGELTRAGGHAAEAEARTARASRRARGWWFVLVGTTLTSLWPVTVAFVVFNLFEAGEFCTGAALERRIPVRSEVDYQFLPPKLVCGARSDGGNSYAATPEVVSAVLSVVLAASVLVTLLGVVWVAVAAAQRPAVRVAHGALAAAVACVISPLWMFYMSSGLEYSTTPESLQGVDASAYAAQFVVAALLPLVVAFVGAVALGALSSPRSPEGRGAATAAVVLALVLLVPTMLWGFNAGLQILRGDDAPRDSPVSADSQEGGGLPSGDPFDDPDSRIDGAVPPQAPVVAPSTATTAAQLRADFTALVSEVVAVAGPSFAPPASDGLDPGGPVDIGVGTITELPCAENGAGVSYSWSHVYSASASADWDVGYDAAAVAFADIAARLDALGYAANIENDSILGFRADPSPLSEFAARHFGVEVRVSLASLCVATDAPA